MARYMRRSYQLFVDKSYPSPSRWWDKGFHMEVGDEGDKAISHDDLFIF